MKKFTHAWIAYKAVERLTRVDADDPNKPFADYLVNWFMNHKDGVIRGAWYPDSVIGDKNPSHIYKYAPVKPDPNQPASTASTPFRSLPKTSLLYKIGKASQYHKKPFTIQEGNNLPERCEAISHAIIDNLRIREIEDKGSPLTPTDNHVALLIFMLSHYVADAHMPMHCDQRDDEFLGFNVHSAVEEYWERQVVRYYPIDLYNSRFIYNDVGFPLFKDYRNTYKDSLLKAVQDEIDARKFQIDYGSTNGNVREYILAVSQYSYLTSYAWLPLEVSPADKIDHNAPEKTGALSFREMSIAALSDAIDDVARVWLHDLRRFVWWKQDKEK